MGGIGTMVTRFALMFAAVVVANLGSTAQAQTEAKAASGPPLDIAIFVSSRKDLCYDRGYVDATRRLTTLAQNQINARGGIGGRPIQLKYLDNKQDVPTTIANVREALADPQLLAMIGLSSSTRGEATFNELAGEIGKSGVPFISHISVSDIFKDQPNVFSTRPAQEVERVPVMVKFIAQAGYSSVAFLGRKSGAWIEAIGDGLKASLGPETLVSDIRIKRHGSARHGELDEAELAAAVEEIKTKQPAAVVVAVGSSMAGSVLEALRAAGTSPAILMVGSIDRIPDRITRTYPNAIYELTWGRPPEVDYDSVRSVVGKDNPDDWIFEGRKVPEAPGWKKGQCKPGHIPEAFSEENLRAIAFGAQFADMVRLVATGARKTEKKAEITKMHAAVLSDLGKAYAAGKGAFKGTFENWSFHPDSRARAKTPFIVILPQGLGRTQLAPFQYIRTRSGALRLVDTLYLDIDLIRAYNIDNNEKSFFAQFYVAMRVSDRIDIKDIEFTNAYLDPRTNGPLISITTVHPGGKSDAYPETMRIYRVNGRFRFTPDFAAYPFDAQRFTIDLQPKSGDKPFVIQPPPLKLRDDTVLVEGWDVTNQYVSYLDDFVPIVDAYTHAPSIVPFFRTRFVWQMKRETTDYYLRVVVPLAFILIVAYLSIFIPQQHLEAIVTIQITALLSAVALYLSLPQIDSDVATLSDRIFVFDYMMVSLMIMISIMRINVRVGKMAWINWLLSFTHIVAIPAMIAVVFVFVLKAVPIDSLEGLPGLEALRTFVTHTLKL
jgi:Periplasmic binding protein